MDAEVLILQMRRAAERLHAAGTTSAELYAQARAQEDTGFSVSAPFTRLLASAVKELEEKS